jgi:hypothetical protein
VPSFLEHSKPISLYTSISFIKPGRIGNRCLAASLESWSRMSPAFSSCNIIVSYTACFFSPKIRGSMHHITPEWEEHHIARAKDQVGWCCLVLQSYVGFRWNRYQDWIGGQNAGASGNRFLWSLSLEHPQCNPKLYNACRMLDLIGIRKRR